MNKKNDNHNSVKFKLIRTAQRLKLNKTHGDEFDVLDELSQKVKTQLKHFKKLESTWKSLEGLLREFFERSKIFESEFLTTCDVKCSQHSTLSISFNTVDSREIFDQMKNNLERLLSDIKQTGSAHQDFLVLEKLINKSNDRTQKENFERECSQRKTELRKKCDQLQEDVKKQISENEKMMRNFLTRYFEKKHSLMKEETELSLDYFTQLHQMQGDGSARNSINSISLSKVGDSNNYRLSSINGDYINGALGFPTELSSKPSSGPYPSLTSSNSTVDNDISKMPKPFEVVATFAYKSQENDELQFDAGDKITVREWPSPEDEEPGWLYGVHEKTGNKGLFPINHVKLP